MPGSYRNAPVRVDKEGSRELPPGHSQPGSVQPATDIGSPILQALLAAEAEGKRPESPAEQQAAAVGFQ